MSSTPFLDGVTIRGNGLTKALRDRCTAASIDGSTNEVTQLTLKFTDPGWVLLNSGLFALRASVAIDDFNMEIASINTGDDLMVENVTIKARPSFVRALKERRGTKVMKHSSPSDFVISECKAVKAPYKVETSAKRTSVARDVPQKGTQEVDNPPSSWTTFDRLAGELGYITFESAGTIYFGRPSWIISNAPAGHYDARYKSGADDSNRWFTVPQCQRSLDSPAQTISGSMRVDKASVVRAGTRLDVSNVPTFNGQYLVTSFSLDLLDSARLAEIQAGVGLNPDPTETTGAQPRRGTRLASDFVYWAKKQIGNTFKSSVVVDLGSFDPAVFNTSELVQWAAAQIGVFMPDGADNQIDFCGQEGSITTLERARRFAGTILWKSGSMGIHIGSGQVIEHVGGKLGVRKYGSAFKGYARAAFLPNVKYF